MGFQDEITVLVLSIAIISIVTLLYKKFMYITFNEEQAKVSGLDVSRMNYLFIVLASITVITSIRLVGVLLISSLIVIPNVTAMLFGKGFKKTAIISILVAVGSVEIGIMLSYIWNIAPGGTIVLTSIAIFLFTISINTIFRMMLRKKAKYKKTEMRNIKMQNKE